MIDGPEVPMFTRQTAAIAVLAATAAVTLAACGAPAPSPASTLAPSA